MTECGDQHANEAVRRVEIRNRFGTTLVMEPPRLRNPLPGVDLAFHECLFWMFVVFGTRLQLRRRNGLLKSAAAEEALSLPAGEWGPELNRGEQHQEGEKQMDTA